MGGAIGVRLRTAFFGLTGSAAATVMGSAGGTTLSAFWTGAAGTTFCAKLERLCTSLAGAVEVFVVFVATGVVLGAAAAGAGTDGVAATASWGGAA